MAPIVGCLNLRCGRQGELKGVEGYAPRWELLVRSLPSLAPVQSVPPCHRHLLDRSTLQLEGWPEIEAGHRKKGGNMGQQWDTSGQQPTPY